MNQWDHFKQETAAEQQCITETNRRTKFLGPSGKGEEGPTNCGHCGANNI